MGSPPKTTLGRTGLEVTRLGYGAMALTDPRRWYGRVYTEDDARLILHAVLDGPLPDDVYAEAKRRLDQVVSDPQSVISEGSSAAGRGATPPVISH